MTVVPALYDPAAPDAAPGAALDDLLAVLAGLAERVAEINALAGAERGMPGVTVALEQLEQADASFQALQRRQHDPEAHAAFLPVAPALAAATAAILDFAAEWFRDASADAVARDAAAGLVIAGAAWVRPDGAIMAGRRRAH